MAKTKKIAPALCRVHLDFHTPDFVPNVGEKLDADRFTEVLAKGEVEQAAFFAKCHYGNAYYPTKVGRPHPGLQCDMLGRFVEAGRKRGVRTFAYYSLQFDYYYGSRHPETVQLTEPFVPHNWGPWIATCVNNSYGEYARKQIAEVVERYAVAGVWLDIVGYYPHCVCPNCRASYQKDTGKPLPFDESKPEAGVGADYQLWQRQMLDRYTNDLADMMGKIRPGCELLCNTASGITEKPAGQANQRDGQWCEESVGNRPATLTTISLYSSLFDSAPERRPFEICSQRTHMGWGDWTLRPLDALNFDTASIIAHGGLPSIGDQLYGDGSFDPVVYQRVGEAYRWLKPRQDFCGETASAAEVAVFSQLYTHRSDPGGILYRADECRNGEGLFKMMLDAHCSATMLSTLDHLAGKRYAVALIDDNLPDTPAGVAALKNFLDGGGKVLSVGLGPQRYWPLLGIKDAKPLSNTVSYIRMAEAPVPELAMPVLARIQGQGVTLEDGARTLGTWTHPLCLKTKDTFFSHQHAPPGEPTREPAVWTVRRGKGRVVGIAAPLATDYWHTTYPPVRHIVAACLDTLLEGRRQLHVQGVPAAGEVTLRKNAKGAMFAHIIVPGVSRPGVTARDVTFFVDEAQPTVGVALALRLPKGKACRAAYQLGERLKVTKDIRPGYVRVNLSPFATHTVVRFDIIAR